MKQRRFGNVLPVRLSNSVDARLKDIAECTGLSKSEVLRLAIANGLPDLEAGRINMHLMDDQKNSQS